MQSLKWFFIAVFVAPEMLKIQWDRMLGKIVTCFRKHLAFLEERFFLSVAHNMQVEMEDAKWKQKGLREET